MRWSQSSEAKTSSNARDAFSEVAERASYPLRRRSSVTRGARLLGWRGIASMIWLIGSAQLISVGKHQLTAARKSRVERLPKVLTEYQKTLAIWRANFVWAIINVGQSWHLQMSSCWPGSNTGTIPNLIGKPLWIMLEMEWTISSRDEIRERSSAKMRLNVFRLTVWNWPGYTGRMYCMGLQQVFWFKKKKQLLTPWGWIGQFWYLLSFSMSFQ